MSTPSEWQPRCSGRSIDYLERQGTPSVIPAAVLHLQALRKRRQQARGADSWPPRAPSGQCGAPPTGKSFLLLTPEQPWPGQTFILLPSNCDG